MLIASLIIFQLIFFGALIFIFRKMMTRNVVLATRHLDDMNQEFSSKEKKINLQMEEAKLKSEALVNKAQEDAEKLKMEIISGAEAERDKMLCSARTHSEDIIQQAEKSRQQLLSEVEQRIVKQAVIQAGQLIQKALPVEFRRAVHGQWLEDLLVSGFGQLERLHLPEDLAEIKIVSAFALSDQQRQVIHERLTSSLGKKFSFKEEVDPTIVAGIVVSIGSLVLDGSLNNKIQELSK